jgi:uncharacterized protein
MKLVSILAAHLFLGAGAFCQKIYFPPAGYADSSSVGQQMSSLARTVISRYSASDKASYYDNLFRLQLVAGDYSAALRTLDTSSRLIFPDTSKAKGFGFLYRTYLMTIAAFQKDSSRTFAKDSSKSFADLYKEIFIRLHRPLSPDATVIADGVFLLDQAYLKKDFKEQITIQKQSGKDSIGLEDAVRLCRAWCLYFFADKTGAGKELVSRFENEKYFSDDSVLIRMPDGGSVSLTIVRKRDVAAPQPVVLLFSIYPRFDHRAAKESAARGYVGIVANTRGKRLSPDQTEPFEHDARDAWYIIDWISKQPWCNGKVGMYGGSYLGFSQWSAAKSLHPALKTIVPQVAVGAGIDYPMQNGVFQSYMLQWIHYVVNNKYTDEEEFDNADRWDSVNNAWYETGRSFRALDTIDGRPNAIFQRWLDHPSYDGFWQNMTPQKKEFTRINIPVLTISGYWDDDQVGAMYYFKQHNLWNKNANHYLLIGPYNHEGAQGFPRKSLGAYNLDSIANIQIQDIVFDWFNHVLKDSSLPAILADKVNLEVMGANKWNHFPALSKISNDSLIFYFSNVISGDHYKLSSAQPPGTGYIEQQVDFKERIIDKHAEATGGKFIDSILDRGNKLVFKTDPMLQKTVFSGSFTTSLVLSVNKKDVDIEYALYEQLPDGRYFFLNRTVQRLSYAKDRTTRHLLQPGKIETIELNNNFLTCIQLAERSRLVLTIGVNKSPDSQINYGTGRDVSDETIADANVPLQIKWYNSSILIVPILK